VRLSTGRPPPCPRIDGTLGALEAERDALRSAPADLPPTLALLDRIDAGDRTRAVEVLGDRSTLPVVDDRAVLARLAEDGTLRRGPVLARRRHPAGARDRLGGLARRRAGVGVRRPPSRRAGLSCRSRRRRSARALGPCRAGHGARRSDHPRQGGSRTCGRGRGGRFGSVHGGRPGRRDGTQTPAGARAGRPGHVRRAGTGAAMDRRPAERRSARRRPRSIGRQPRARGSTRVCVR
jgi:hypothetical protein